MITERQLNRDLRKLKKELNKSIFESFMEDDFS